MKGTLFWLCGFGLLFGLWLWVGPWDSSLPEVQQQAIAAAEQRPELHHADLSSPEPKLEQAQQPVAALPAPVPPRSSEQGAYFQPGLARQINQDRADSSVLNQVVMPEFVPGEYQNWATEAEANSKEILHRLWAMQGGIRPPAIRIQPLEGYGKPAEYDLDQREIILDPRAYQLCQQLSPQTQTALAFLLAHELVHAYQHQHLAYTSPGFFVETKTLKQWAEGQKQRRRSMESQADTWGAILCHLSGYEVEQSVPQFISALYDHFGLRDEDPLYDSRLERMAIAERAQAEIQQSIALFDMGVNLSVLQQHDKDTTIYQYLIEHFRSPEFFNNLGLSYLRSAIPRLDEPYRSFPYPLSLDAQTRLEHISSKGRVRPEWLIRQAIEQFDEVANMNPRHQGVYLHRASARQMLSTLQFPVEPEMRGMIEADLQQLSPREQKYAAPLLQLLQSPTDRLYESRLHVSPPPSGKLDGEVDGVDLSEAYRLLRMEMDWKTELSFSENILAYGKAYPNSQLTVYHHRPQARLLAMQQVKGPVALGSYAKQVHQVGSRIGEAAQRSLRESLPSSLGHTFWVDDRLGIVYETDERMRVLSWTRWQSWE